MPRRTALESIPATNDPASLMTPRTVPNIPKLREETQPTSPLSEAQEKANELQERANRFSLRVPVPPTQGDHRGDKATDDFLDLLDRDNPPSKDTVPNAGSPVAIPQILLTDDGIVDIGARMAAQLLGKRKTLYADLERLHKEVKQIDKEFASWETLVASAKARLNPPPAAKV
jgi:hypothetical protein